MLSMRSPTLTRLYLQVDPRDTREQWPDDRIWEHLHRRLATDDGWTLNEGPIIEFSVAPIRAFVAEPMRYGRLFLAGDAAHIVPPTGAKGLKLAASDVRYLSCAFREYYDEKSSAGIDSYSETALARVWKAVRFSWWMTEMMHRFPDTAGFGARIQMAELNYLVGSQAATTSLAENYVGLPY
jgi:p-hydroxybenzoate 3-monooxygenase